MRLQCWPRRSENSTPSCREGAGGPDPGRGRDWLGGRPEALLLAPGAASDRHHPSLVAIEAAVAPMPVARVDFPYRRAGRKAPDPAPRMVACVIEEATALAARAGVSPERVALGGRSMGGRICSMAVAQGLSAAGLVLVAYPLHPPGRPERLRTEHFPASKCPACSCRAPETPSGPLASSKAPQPK